MKLAGYDWGPHAVDLSTAQEPAFKRHADAKHDYVWENGASLCAECLATGKEPLFTPEHALHVVEIITAARESQTGSSLRSTLKTTTPGSRDKSPRPICSTICCPTGSTTTFAGRTTWS
jgi:hypothetical protein